MHVGSIDISCRHASVGNVTDSCHNVNHHADVLTTSSKLLCRILTNQVLSTAHYPELHPDWVKKCHTGHFWQPLAP